MLIASDRRLTIDGSQFDRQLNRLRSPTFRNLRQMQKLYNQRSSCGWSRFYCWYCASSDFFFDFAYMFQVPLKSCRIPQMFAIRHGNVIKRLVSESKHNVMPGTWQTSHVLCNIKERVALTELKAKKKITPVVFSCLLFKNHSREIKRHNLGSFFYRQLTICDSFPENEDVS